jgi:hypothetical protein
MCVKGGICTPALGKLELTRFHDNAQFDKKIGRNVGGGDAPLTCSVPGASGACDGICLSRWRLRMADGVPGRGVGSC